MLRLAMPLSRLGTNVVKKNLLKSASPKSLMSRQYVRGVREPPKTSQLTQTENKGPSLKEKLMEPPSENAYSIGKGAAAGAAGVGLLALCYYGAHMNKGDNIYSQSMFWPQYVSDRIHSTYSYFGGACALSAASAVSVFRSPRLLQMVTRNGWMSIAATFAAMIGSGVLCQSIKYRPGFGAKQMAWAMHCAIMGAVIAPICFLGGPILTRAALYTGGIVGGLSTVAVCAPSDKFLYMGGPLAIGLGLVFASSLAGMWLPPTTALGAGMASMSLYGGLLLFGGFLLFDTQRIVKQAENYNETFGGTYDPVNASLAIYMDTLNIFIRIATIMAGGGGNRRR